ncbi:GPCR kinase [Tanacetum coccineum]
MSSDPNYEWEQLLDIDDSDLPLTPVLRPYNSHVRETSTTTTTQNTGGSVQVEKMPVKIITGPAGVVQVEEKPVRIIPGSALILANVSVFSPKLSMHYLNITMRNVIKVFHKDSVPGNGSGVGGSGMLMEEEEIVKLMEEEEMADLKLQVCWNVTHQEMADEEALNLALDEEARQARARVVREM